MCGRQAFVWERMGAVARFLSWSSRHFTGLWRHPDFLKLWGGQTVSLFGTLVSGFALSLTAILVLGASAAEVAWLHAARYAPGLVVGLFAGVVVDRLPRRPLLIAADVGRALLVGSIPVAALMGRLTLTQLSIVALLTSVLTVFFDVAYGAYLPSLVTQAHLAEGYSKLRASAAVAEAGGFGASGFLIAAFTAPGALLVDAVSFLVSALSLGSIRARETRRVPAEGEPPAHLWRDIREGLAFVRRTPVVRAVAGSGATMALFGNIVGVVILLDWTERLALSPVAIGLVGGVGGLSAFVGAAVTPRLVRRWGVGRLLVRALAVSRAAAFLVVLADGPVWLAVTLLAVAQLFDGADVAHEIAAATLRQTATPDTLLGRVDASLRVLEWGATLGGIALGGVLGGLIGTRGALLVGFIGKALARLWFVRLRLDAAPAVAAHAPPQQTLT